MSRSAPAG